MARPEGLAPYQHIDAAEQLLSLTEEANAIQLGKDEQHPLTILTVAICALAHAQIAQAKMTGSQRR